jgi:hypothetical protein
MICTNRTEKSGKKFQQKAVPARLRRLLEGKLLPLGGSQVIWQSSDPHAALIAARGEEFPQRVRMRRGEPNRCHVNAAELWAGATDRYQLATGYALSADHWVGHSWVVDAKNVYETTLRFERYFGVVLPPFLALKFWFENFYVHYYPDGKPPADFWDSRPGVVALMDQFARLPKEDWSRAMTGCSQVRCA